MDNLLENVEPRLLWKHFQALSAIPRGSKNEQQAAAHVLAEGRRMGLESVQDACGNVLIRKPATPGRENSPTIVLQGHLDMVCEKNEETVHDFLKDPIRLVRDGDTLRADGTTLGADNGIGVAAALAVLESDDFAHGPLECLFTIDEETGLTGAANLAPGFLKGTYLLNLDSEEEGVLCIGCAGGMDTVATRRVTRSKPSCGKTAFRLKVAGLQGGHSGMDIHKGRGNALRFLGRILWTAVGRYGLELASFHGGSKRNAIPREAFAVFFMDPAQESAFRSELSCLQEDLRSELGAFDPGLALLLEPATSSDMVMTAGDARTVVNFLFSMTHGVLAMSPDIPGLVQTSTNLAIIETREDEVEVCMSHRSSVECSKKATGQMVAALCELAGFGAKAGDGYPGWKPEPDSSLVRLVNSVHEEEFGKPMKLEAIHAGLECGLIGEKFPGMEMVSFGPNMSGVHSPDEKVSISSVNTFYRFLVAILKKA